MAATNRDVEKLRDLQYIFNLKSKIWKFIFLQLTNLPLFPTEKNSINPQCVSELLTSVKNECKKKKPKVFFYVRSFPDIVFVFLIVVAVAVVYELCVKKTYHRKKLTLQLQCSFHAIKHDLNIQIYRCRRNRILRIWCTEGGRSGGVNEPWSTVTYIRRYDMYGGCVSV